MPVARMCAYGGCPHYAVDEGSRYCPLHQDYEREQAYAAGVRSRARKARDPKHVARGAVYADPRWRQCRKVVLARDGHRCQMCTTGDDLTVDHIEGLTYTDEDFNPDNCWTLCRSCHGRKSNADRERIALGAVR